MLGFRAKYKITMIGLDFIKIILGEFVVAIIAVNQFKLIGINLIGILNHVKKS